MRVLAVSVAAVALSGCVTSEAVQFHAVANQQALVRDGKPALVSTKHNSIVIVGPASRRFQVGGRPVFVLAIYNRSKRPLDFKVSDVHVTQPINGEVAELKVITYDDLVREEHTRQVFRAVAAGLGAAGNAIAASQAGYYHSSSTVYGPGGTYNLYTTGYSPTAAAIAQQNASARNAEMIDSTIARGRANLAYLERSVIKDDTLLPGEWYGGQLHIQPLISSGGEQKDYTIAVTIGSDRHEIHISQGGGTS